MVQHGIVLGHEISREGIKVDKAKVEIIVIGSKKCIFITTFTIIFPYLLL